MLKDKQLEKTDNKLSADSEKQSVGFFRFLFRYLSKYQNLIEILNLVRPLIYLGMLMVFKQKSYLPLIVSLIVDIIILKFYRKEEKFVQQKIFSFEYNRRYFGLFFYIMREPIFSNFTKPLVKGFLSKIWISPWIIDLILNLLSYFTNFYYIL